MMVLACCRINNIKLVSATAAGDTDEFVSQRDRMLQMAIMTAANNNAMAV